MSDDAVYVTALAIPFASALAAIIAAVIVLVIRIKIYERRYGKRKRECVNCGYNLTQCSSPKCPECGANRNYIA